MHTCDIVFPRTIIKTYSTLIFLVEDFILQFKLFYFLKVGTWRDEEANFNVSKTGCAAFFPCPFVFRPLRSQSFVVLDKDFDWGFKEKQVPDLRAPSGVPARYN